MMSLTPERRKELRELATRHQEKRQHVTGVKAAPEQETRQPETRQEVAATPAAPATEAAASSLFPDMEAGNRRRKLPTFLPVRSTVCQSRTTVTALWYWMRHAISAI